MSSDTVDGYWHKVLYAVLEGVGSGFWSMSHGIASDGRFEISMESPLSHPPPEKSRKVE